MSTPAELQAQYLEAKVAYHQLMTGQMARVVVDQSGQRVEYANANRELLGAYLANLHAQVCPPEAIARTMGGPASFIF